MHECAQVAFDLLAVYVDEGGAFGASAEACSAMTQQVAESIQATGTPFLIARLEDAFDAGQCCKDGNGHGDRSGDAKDQKVDCRGQLVKLLQVSML